MRLCRDSGSKPVIRQLAEQLNVHRETLRNWIRQDSRRVGIPRLVFLLSDQVPPDAATGLVAVT